MGNGDIELKRVYEPPSPEDGRRVLVDRLWPRGLKKEGARLFAWCKEAAPSPDLRAWFGHRTERFEEFRARYEAELQDDPDRRRAVDEILEWAAGGGRLTLLYAAKDERHNQAVVLRDHLRARLDAGRAP